MKTKICIVTGSRAEYGLLRPLIKTIRANSAFQLQLLVTGAHLSLEFGLSVADIERDGVRIDERVEIVLSADSSTAVCKSMGLALICIGEALSRLAPDLVLVLGDRYEIFCTAAASNVCKIPVAHLHGGETTQGAFDEGFRHGITKLSYLHFTSTEVYRKRVIQLGEDPVRVFNVGALGLDVIRQTHLLTNEELTDKLKIRWKRRNLLVTYHPVTLQPNSAKAQFSILLDALSDLQDTLLIFTKANADPEGRVINSMIERYCYDHPEDAISFASMGQENYLSTMTNVDAVVGNSSSGIIEAPSLGTGTINIGERQTGRIAAASVLHCAPHREDIQKALNRIYSDDFIKLLSSVVNPYGNGHAADRIFRTLLSFSGGTIPKKEFYDVRFEFDSAASGSNALRGDGVL